MRVVRCLAILALAAATAGATPRIFTGLDSQIILGDPGFVAPQLGKLVLWGSALLAAGLLRRE